MHRAVTAPVQHRKSTNVKIYSTSNSTVPVWHSYCTVRALVRHRNSIKTAPLVVTAPFHFLYSTSACTRHQFRLWWSNVRAPAQPQPSSGTVQINQSDILNHHITAFNFIICLLFSRSMHCIMHLYFQFTIFGHLHMCIYIIYICYEHNFSYVVLMLLQCIIRFVLIDIIVYII